LHVWYQRVYMQPIVPVVLLVAAPLLLVLVFMACESGDALLLLRLLPLVRHRTGHTKLSSSDVIS
jgi:hypothetical protein